MRLVDSVDDSPGREADGNGRIPAEILERLKPRERDVLVEFLTEPNVKRIAKRLGLADGTVANYLTAIRQHLRVRSQAELMKLLYSHRPTPSPPQSHEKTIVKVCHKLLDARLV